jgi:hypothetical protein
MDFGPKVRHNWSMNTHGLCARQTRPPIGELPKERRHRPVIKVTPRPIKPPFAYETSARSPIPSRFTRFPSGRQPALGHGQRNRMTHPLIPLASLASLARTALFPTPAPAWHGLIPEAPVLAPGDAQPGTSDRTESNLIKVDHTQSKSIETDFRGSGRGHGTGLETTAPNDAKSHQMTVNHAKLRLIFLNYLPIHPNEWQPRP